MLARLPALTLLLAMAAPPAAAQFISGRVVTPLGAGVAGVNINAENNGSGGDPDLFNDGTDAAGFFTTTVDPAGTYDFLFVPPSGSGYVVKVLANVSVPGAGTLQLGNVVLEDGALVTGTVRDTLGNPVPDANLDVLHPVTGDLLLTPGDTTNSLGQFQLVVPFGNWTLTIDTPGNKALAPKSMALAALADVSLGQVTLQPGFLVSATVLRPNLTGVANADLDVFDAVTGVQLFTPGDNSDAAGFVDVVVPAGSYDIEVTAPLALKLVGKTVAGVAVAADTNLGIIQLQAGQILQGTVRNAALQPIAGVDVDVTIASSGLDVTLSGDNTQANGTYAVIVPSNTTIHVEFEPPYSLPYGSQTVANVVVTTVTKVQNGSLPDLPFHVAYGTGLAGLGGFVPLLGSSGGAPRFGNPDYALELSAARGGASSFLLVGFAQASLPFKQGTLLVDVFGGPGLMLTLPVLGPANVAGAGFFTLPAPVPEEPLLAGLTWYAQYLVQDAAAAKGFAMTNAVAVTWLP
jgi:hypothetical protein